jgi:hypothetical protein
VQVNQTEAGLLHSEHRPEQCSANAKPPQVGQATAQSLQVAHIIPVRIVVRECPNL